MEQRRHWVIRNVLRLHEQLPGERTSALLVAALGVALATAIAGLIGAWARGRGYSAPWLAASVGGSAVLMFVLPTSPLAQPWPVLGGNCLSALVGVACGHWLGHGALSYAVAAGVSLLAMAATMSLHPPGLGSALAGVSASGWLFPWAPIGLNALVLIAVGLVFHRFSGHAYPRLRALTRRPQPSAPTRSRSATPTSTRSSRTWVRPLTSIATTSVCLSSASSSGTRRFAGSPQPRRRAFLGPPVS